MIGAREKGGRRNRARVRCEAAEEGNNRHLNVNVPRRVENDPIEAQAMSDPAQACGPLREAFGVPDGTPGRIDVRNNHAHIQVAH